MAVLGGEDCCNKMSQMEWLRAPEMYCVTVPEGGSLKRGVDWAILPLEVLGRDLF